MPRRSASQARSRAPRDRPSSPERHGLTAYLATSLAILLTPGPTNTLLAAGAAATGWRRALALPLAEALGYAVAISLYRLAGTGLAAFPLAMTVLKALAAIWLMVSALALWTRPVVPAPGGGFGPVLVTTLVNPKAMLVALIVLPGLMPGAEPFGTGLFVLLSTLAGLGWVFFGALLPARLRRYSYKGAALIISGFALAAMVSALQG